MAGDYAKCFIGISSFYLYNSSLHSTAEKSRHQAVKRCVQDSTVSNRSELRPSGHKVTALSHLVVLPLWFNIGI